MDDCDFMADDGAILINDGGFMMNDIVKMINDITIMIDDNAIMISDDGFLMDDNAFMMGDNAFMMGDNDFMTDDNVIMMNDIAIMMDDGGFMMDDRGCWMVGAGVIARKHLLVLLFRLYFLFKGLHECRGGIWLEPKEPKIQGCVNFRGKERQFLSLFFTRKVTKRIVQKNAPRFWTGSRAKPVFRFLVGF